MDYEFVQWSVGGDISMNHGAIVTCKWGWNEELEVPVLLEYLDPLVYLKNDYLGKLMNSSSEFPREIEKFSSEMVKIISGHIWDTFLYEHQFGDHDPMTIVAIEWANITANYRGSRKLASVVHGQTFAMIWLLMNKKYGMYFTNPSLTRAFRGKEKLTESADYENLELQPFLVPSDIRWFDIQNKEGDVFDAVLVSLIGFLEHNSRLDDYVIKIKQERKELNAKNKEG